MCVLRCVRGTGCRLSTHETRKRNHLRDHKMPHGHSKYMQIWWIKYVSTEIKWTEHTFLFVLTSRIPLNDPFEKQIYRWRLVGLAFASSVYPFPIQSLIWKCTFFFFVPIAFAQENKLHTVSIKSGINCVPGTRVLPKTLSTLRLSSCHHLCTLPVPIHQADRLSLDLTPSVELCSERLMWSEYQGLTVSLHNASHSNLVSLWREAYFYRHFFRPFLSKSVWGMENSFVKPREPWFPLCWTQSAFGKVFLERPLVIIWWHPTRNWNCHLNQWVPSWAATKQS